MKRLLTILLLGTLFPGDAGADGNNENPDPGPEVTTLAHVDLQRYTGTWYEIAKIPNRFQKNCARGTTAQYNLRDDGKITVLNSCYDEDGSLDETEGLARVVDTETNAKLEVSFVSFLGWRPFWGDYWVLGLDEGYQWAIVGTPDRKYGWILARSSTLPDEKLELIFSILVNNGYRRESFTMSAP